MHKEFEPTKGLMGPESHQLCIKPQLAGGSISCITEDMNFDFDNDEISFSQPYDPFSSPPQPPVMDMVDWANSQPVALKCLLSEATKRPEKRPTRCEPTWSHSAEPSNRVASTSRGPPEARSRPLRRTNSSMRARLGPDAPSTSSNPPPSPDATIWGKDRQVVLAACQNVSERMDENAFLLAAQSINNEPPKRKPKAHHVADVQKLRRFSAPHSVGVTRWDKGKHRASVLSLEAKPLSTRFQRSVSTPTAIPLPQTASSSSSGTSSETSSESPDTSMMDLDPCDGHPLASPFVTPSIKRPQSESIRFTSTSSTSSSSPTDAPSPFAQVPPPAPKVQLHPLLTQTRPKDKSIFQLARHPQPPFPQPPLPQPPPLSQSTRPPVLGMRRAHTAPTSGQHTLPTRQKGFKPPLLSQPAPSPVLRRTEVAMALRAETRVTSRYRAEEGRPASRSPSPEMDTDADSSFGDISFGLDDEALELTMRQYD